MTRPVRSISHWVLDFMATGVRISATAAVTGVAGMVIATVGAMIAMVGAMVATVGAMVADVEGAMVADVEGTTMGKSRVETADVREVVVVEDATKLVEPVVTV